MAVLDGASELFIGRGRRHCTFVCASVWCWHGDRESRAVIPRVVWCMTGLRLCRGYLLEFDLMLCYAMLLPCSISCPISYVSCFYEIMPSYLSPILPQNVDHLYPVFLTTNSFPIPKSDTHLYMYIPICIHCPNPAYYDDNKRRWKPSTKAKCLI